MTMPCNSTTTTTIIVPTKVEDNCSYSASFMRQITGQQQEESKSKFDAFQHYSSDLLRLKTLLLSDDEDDDELNALAAVNDALRSAGLSDIAAKDASKRRRGNSSQSITSRKMQELHARHGCLGSSIRACFFTTSIIKLERISDPFRMTKMITKSSKFKRLRCPSSRNEVERWICAFFSDVPIQFCSAHHQPSTYVSCMYIK
eukprot:scaffold9563_cov150-Skeletonema_marinoi.AAC.5